MSSQRQVLPLPEQVRQLPLAQQALPSIDGQRGSCVRRLPLRFRTGRFRQEAQPVRAQLAVDRHVEHGEITHAIGELQPRTYSPDMFRLQWRLRTDHPACVPRLMWSHANGGHDELPSWRPHPTGIMDDPADAVIRIAQYSALQRRSWPPACDAGICHLRREGRAEGGRLLFSVAPRATPHADVEICVGSTEMPAAEATAGTEAS